ncbi:MAG: DMT family transporter [Anaerolineae bacterium]|nr:DMT family transporter [Anaerolineae bacterium]
MGELAALGTSLCFSFGSVLFTLSGREMGSPLVNRMRLLVAVLMVMLLHTLTFGQPIPLDAGTDRWFWLGLSGFVGLALGDAFLFQAFVLIGPRLAMLMMALAPVLGTLLAWLFLGETLVTLEFIGISITIAGIMLVIAERSGQGKTEPTDKRRYVIGLLCGLGGAVGQAGGLVLSKMGLGDGFPALSGNVIRVLIAVVIIWILAVANRQLISSYRTLRAHPRAMLMLTGGAVLGPVLGVWLSLVAVQNTNVGVASTLSSLMPIFLIPISYVVFGERVTRQAIIGTLIAFVGMVILFL